jgi:hypothetical protein
MFGRRKVPFGSKPPEPPIPPPGGAEPFPIDKMDRALDGAIRLFTRVLDDAGIDPGPLAIRGEVPTGVTQALAECTSFRGQDDGGMTFLVLGLTEDFKGFAYPPHCELFLIINSAGICEDRHAASILRQLAPGQLPGPLVHAHFMRRWVHYILPTGAAMKGGAAALKQLHERLMGDLASVQAPPALSQQLDLKAMFTEWCGGFPAAYTQALTPETERMNGLPVTPFIEKTLTNYLAQMQARGLRDRA